MIIGCFALVEPFTPVRRRSPPVCQGLRAPHQTRALERYGCRVGAPARDAVRLRHGHDPARRWRGRHPANRRRTAGNRLRRTDDAGSRGCRKCQEIRRTLTPVEPIGASGRKRSHEAIGTRRRLRTGSGRSRAYSPRQSKTMAWRGPGTVADRKNRFKRISARREPRLGPAEIHTAISCPCRVNSSMG